MSYFPTKKQWKAIWKLAGCDLQHDRIYDDMPVDMLRHLLDSVFDQWWTGCNESVYYIIGVWCCVETGKKMRVDFVLDQYEAESSIVNNDRLLFLGLLSKRIPA